MKSHPVSGGVNNTDMMKFLNCGETALTVQFSDEISESVNRRIRFVAARLSGGAVKGVRECVPTFVSLTVYFDPFQISVKKLKARIESINSEFVDGKAGIKRIFIIPVCYEGDFAPDIKDVADHAGLSVNEVISIHTGTDYLIYMLGFLPGFPYLGGLDQRIHTPRLNSPRTRIPPGAVGIGGEQTGIYPLASPGGWRLIGQTPLKPYDPEREEPILYKAGDYIRFKAINKDEYDKIVESVSKGQYKTEILEEKE